jgi:quercetin dioxygenase-like cupin family protein
MNMASHPITQLSGQEPRTVHFLGNLLTFLARCSDTEGRFSLMECETAPGAGSPPHTQEDEEAFLIMEGQYAFQLGDEKKICGPGEFVFVKPGTPHAFLNPTGSPSKMLIINLPGGMHEGFFMAVGDPVKPGEPVHEQMGPPDVELLTTIAARFGIAILPPAGA